jgi:hypothetical protein
MSRKRIPPFNEDTWAAYTWAGCIVLCFILPPIIYFVK